jgi:hypothetical protein
LIEQRRIYEEKKNDSTMRAKRVQPTPKLYRVPPFLNQVFRKGEKEGEKTFKPFPIKHQ